MTFISYAQNCEDVILSRALKGVEKGFYVDVGAMDPVFDSVTKAFHERGWRGINIEPVHQWYEKLALDRPEDINLNLALLDKPSIIHLYEIADTGLSTFDRVLAERHKQKEGYQIRDVATTALTLDIVLEEHPHEEIHFLKVGVEGAERQGLQAALDAKEVERQALQTALSVVYASRSWRVTLPLRKVTDVVRGLMRRQR